MISVVLWMLRKQFGPAGYRISSFRFILNITSVGELLSTVNHWVKFRQKHTLAWMHFAYISIHIIHGDQIPTTVALQYRMKQLVGTILVKLALGIFNWCQPYLKTKWWINLTFPTMVSQRIASLVMPTASNAVLRQTLWVSLLTHRDWMKHIYIPKVANH